MWSYPVCEQNTLLGQSCREPFRVTKRCAPPSNYIAPVLTGEAYSGWSEFPSLSATVRPPAESSAPLAASYPHSQAAAVAARPSATTRGLYPVPHKHPEWLRSDG